jgi:hypothetical protein
MDGNDLVPPDVFVTVVVIVILPRSAGSLVSNLISRPLLVRHEV